MIVFNAPSSQTDTLAQMGNIVWVASYPKSGNTWVRAFLRNLLLPSSSPASINSLGEICDNESNKRFFQRFAQNADISQPETAAKLRSEVQRDIATGASNTVFLKTHNYFGAFNGHTLHNPSVSAAAIYIVRNPLDLVLSLSHYYRLTIDEAIDFMTSEETTLEDTESNVTCFPGSWQMNVASWTGAPDDPLYCIVRYEDMLDKPLKQFRRIASLIGVKDVKRIKQATNASRFDVLKRQESRSGFGENPNKERAFFRSGRRNQWREALTSEQLNRVVEANRDMMERFGYIPTVD